MNGQHALVFVIALALVGGCNKKSQPTSGPQNTAVEPKSPAVPPQSTTVQPQSPAKAPQDHPARPSRPRMISSAAEFAAVTSAIAGKKANGTDTQAAAAKAGGPDTVALRGQPSPGDCSKCCVDGDCGNVCCFTPGGPENDPGGDPGREPTDCGKCNRKSCIDACEGPPPSGWTNEQCVAFCNCCSHH